MMTTRLLALLAVASILPLAAGCVSRRPPTVAHVHIGHAITGVHVTPNKEGYLVSAEHRAQETVDYTAKAAASHDLAEIKRNIALASQSTDSQGELRCEGIHGHGSQSRHICCYYGPTMRLSTCRKQRRNSRLIRHESSSDVTSLFC